MPRPLNNTDTDLTADNLLRLPAEFGCPVWVYDAQIIRAQIAKLNQFDVIRFAQKGLLKYSYSAPDARAGSESGLGIIR
ncbi:Diaminopimelate decarboxylase [Kluyvera cryocrescens]|uniref:Diaminopimelate decarboxylase n=1 Tax=Kluyvera cryocrescens TaxID=580 RepID=A0A485B374_KLUCR|nr:Diaminopimelate decarboxylase [Kluyvera cryocrescens]